MNVLVLVYSLIIKNLILGLRGKQLLKFYELYIIEEGNLLMGFLSIKFFFATKFGMGILGVKLATFICVLLSSIALTIETFIALKNDLK